MKIVCLFVIRAYQQLFGPFLGGNCRFYPTCSQYAAEAIERHGAGRGSWLAIRRLLRCHPFSPGGVDLVPEARTSDSGLSASTTGAAGTEPEKDFAR